MATLKHNKIQWNYKFIRKVLKDKGQTEEAISHGHMDLLKRNAFPPSEGMLELLSIRAIFMHLLVFSQWHYKLISDILLNFPTY